MILHYIPLIIPIFILVRYRHCGTYMGQDVAIKVIGAEHLNEALGIEFAQEITILR